MKNTAKGEKQKYSILSNELIRRLSNITLDMDKDQMKMEKIGTIDNMTQQMKNSGYSRMETAEAMVSGIRGYRRRVERRKKENNGEFYRHGKNTLKQRVRKKLTEKTTWYREKKKKHGEEEGV